MARFTTATQSHEFSRLFDEFESLIGNRWWLKRVKAIEDELKSKPLLKDFLTRENRLAFALRDLSEQKRQFGQVRDVRVRSDGHYDAYTLVAQFMDLHAALDRHTSPKARLRRGSS